MGGNHLKADYLEYFRMVCVAFSSLCIYKYIRSPNADTIRLFIVGLAVLMVGGIFMQMRG